MKLAVGQYIPNDSLIHRMDPRVKIFIDILLIVLVFLAKDFIISFIVFIPILFAFLLSKLKITKLFSLLKPSLFLLFFLFIINVCILDVNDTTGIRNKDVWFQWQFIQISYEAIRRSLLIFIRVYSMIIVTTILIATTKPLDLTRGIEDLMCPLKLIKFPVHIISMIISIALRFIPTLLIEAERIMKAQASRGVDFKNGSLNSKIKSTITLIIPLFVSAFVKADDLSNAMETRGYDPYAKRTRYRHYVPSIYDYLFLLFTASLFAFVIITRYTELIPLPWSNNRWI